MYKSAKQSKIENKQLGKRREGRGTEVQWRRKLNFWEDQQHDYHHIIIMHWRHVTTTHVAAEPIAMGEKHEKGLWDVQRHDINKQTTTYTNERTTSESQSMLCTFRITNLFVYKLAPAHMTSRDTPPSWHCCTSCTRVAACIRPLLTTQG